MTPFEERLAMISDTEKVDWLTRQFENAVWLPGGEVSAIEIVRLIINNLAREFPLEVDMDSEEWSIREQIIDEAILQRGKKAVELYEILLSNNLVTERAKLANVIYKLVAEYWSSLKLFENWTQLELFLLKELNVPAREQILRTVMDAKDGFEPTRAWDAFDRWVPGEVSYMRSRPGGLNLTAGRIATNAARASLDLPVLADVLSLSSPLVAEKAAEWRGDDNVDRAGYALACDLVRQSVEVVRAAKTLIVDIVTSDEPTNYRPSIVYPRTHVEVLKLEIGRIDIAVDLGVGREHEEEHVQALCRRVTAWHLNHSEIKLNVFPRVRRGREIVMLPEHSIHIPGRASS